MRSLILMVCISLLTAAVLAQNDKGSLAGTVLDPFGEPAAEASIQLINPRSGASLKATTGKDGRYTLSDVPAGSWDVTVSLPAVQGVSQKGVPIAVAKTTTLDLRLKESSQLSTLGEDTQHFLADQKLHRAPSGPAPRTAEGKPDFSGVWWGPVTTDAGKPEWTPWAEQIARERAANNRVDSPKARCLPSNVMFSGQLWELVQSREFLVWISDDDSPGYHQIYIGRSHPQDPNPSWYGDSIAKWEGDTLVVDRVAFDERMWLDQASHPHSDQLHLIEKYRRPDLGHLEIETTMEDPKVLVKPFTQKRVAELAPGQEIFEFICTANASVMWKKPPMDRCG